MTTRAELDQLAVIVNNALGAEALDDNYYIQGAYGRVRLVRAEGSVEVSPSLTKGELAMWIHAFLDGIFAATRGK